MASNPRSRNSLTSSTSNTSITSNSSQPQQLRSGNSTASSSPTDLSSSTLRTLSAASNTTRTVSPSHEFPGRLYPKRAREIQAQEGATPLHSWGPPTSGHSTPLRETIPESPNSESFPNIPQVLQSSQQQEPSVEKSAGIGAQVPTRGRARAGTLPSRLGSSPAASASSLSAGLSLGFGSKTARPTPSTSPFKPELSTPSADIYAFDSVNNDAKVSRLLQRLRADSTPQITHPPRTTYAQAHGHCNNSGVGQSHAPYSSAGSNWGTRGRSSTLASIRSSEGAGSPSLSAFSRDLADGDVKTLNYLGLEDNTPNSYPSTDIFALLEQQNAYGPSAFARNPNRFRSYSVNAKEKYADKYEDDLDYASNYSGSLTPADASVSYNLHELVHMHNMEVQALAKYATTNRPRARTVGVLERPSSPPLGSQLDNRVDMPTFNGAIKALHLSSATPNNNVDGLLVYASTDEAPTRALWLGNIPSSTTVSSLAVIFSAYGIIESSRVLTHKNCGFVNFETTESAINARMNLNGKEIFPGAGPVRIGFAKVPNGSGTPAITIAGALASSPGLDPVSRSTHHASPGATFHFDENSIPALLPELSAPKSVNLQEIKADILKLAKEMGANGEDLCMVTKHVDSAIKHNDNYKEEIPPIPEPNPGRAHDAPRLREIRKRIDSNACTPDEIEEIAVNMLDEVAELASDYIGNTVVQKLFELCSEETKQKMLDRIAPRLAEVGVHKNGTWAAQKIIEVARLEKFMSTIATGLRPYAMALFLDQYGNYVLQGCLRYQSPINDFIFEVMVGRIGELAQGRFGARAMRACLESHHATKHHQRMIAALIALHSVQLATNVNGALLLTWYVDTCQFPRRRAVLTSKLIPHLARLCIHNVAYLTVLKLINQRHEPEARDTILKALFFSPNDSVLEEILSDQQSGATLIFKILTTPCFDEQIRADVVQNVRTVLIHIKAQAHHGYKRLMDEVGLSRAGGGGGLGRDDSSMRPGSKESNLNYNGPRSNAEPSMGIRQLQQSQQQLSQQQHQPPQYYGSRDIGNMGMHRAGGMESTPPYENFARVGGSGVMHHAQMVTSPTHRSPTVYQPMVGRPVPYIGQQGMRMYSQAGINLNPNANAMYGGHAGPSDDAFRGGRMGPSMGVGAPIGRQGGVSGYVPSGVAMYGVVNGQQSMYPGYAGGQDYSQQHPMAAYSGVGGHVGRRPA